MEVLHAMGKFLFDGQAWLNALIVTAVLAAIGIPLEVIQQRKNKLRYQVVFERMRAIYTQSRIGGPEIAVWVFSTLTSPKLLNNPRALHDFIDDVQRAIYQLPRHPDQPIPCLSPLKVTFFPPAT